LRNKKTQNGGSLVIKLQERDYSILLLCYEQQFLILEHVRHFFPNTHRTTSTRRLKELKDSGFLSVEYHPLTGSMGLFRLTQLGLQSIQGRSPYRIIQVKNLNVQTIYHDTIVTSARLKISHFWKADFVPERAIKIKSFPEIPDGIFFFTSGKGIALEVENSDKGRPRFLRLLERWKEAPQIVFVLYVVTTPLLFRSIRSYLKEGPDEPQIGVVLWEELKTGRPLVQTRSGLVPIFEKEVS
jgi:hypothetical protein